MIDDQWSMAKQTKKQKTKILIIIKIISMMNEFEDWFVDRIEYNIYLLIVQWCEQRINFIENHGEEIR